MASEGGGKVKSRLWTKIFSGNTKADADLIPNESDGSQAAGESAVVTDPPLAEQMVEKDVISDAEALAAESKRLREQIEQDIQLAEKDLLYLSERSAQMQKAAVDALEALAEAEHSYAVVESEIAAALAEEESVRLHSEEELDHIKEVNADALATASKNADKLAEGLAAKKEEAAAALLEAEQAAADLASEKTRVNGLIKAKEQEIKQVLTTAEHARAAADKQEKNTEAQFVSLDAELSTYLQEYDQAVRQLSEAEAKRQKYDEQVAEVHENSKQAQLNLTKKLNHTIEAYKEKSSAAKAKRDRLTADLATRRADSEQAAEDMRLSAAAAAEALAALQGLISARDERIGAVEKDKAEISFRLDEARRDVTDKKEAYAQAQKQVERSTSAAVKAGARADAAGEQAREAALETEDVAAAAETAQRLKDEATLARSSSDEASSQMLSKAESVLLNTTEKALRLYEEKVVLHQAAEQEAKQLRAASELAAAEAKRDAEAADRLVAAWLAAEESLVKATVEAEAALKALEEDHAGRLEDEEQQINAAENLSREYAEAAERAAQQNGRLARALEACETELQAAQENLAELEANFEQEKNRIELALADKGAATENSIAYYENELASIEAQFESLIAERDQKRQELDLKAEQFNADKEHLMQQNMERRLEIAAWEKEAVRLQGETEKLLEEMRNRTEEVQLFREARRAAAEEANAQAEKIAVAYDIALQEVERIRRAGEESVARAAQDAQQAVAPKTAIRLAVDERAEQKMAELRELRRQAADAIKGAVEVSLSRLEAQNRASVGKAEQVLAQLEDSVAAAAAEMESAQTLCRQAEDEAKQLAEQAIALRAQEKEIGADADRRYREVERTKNVELSSLDKKLKRLSSAQADSAAALGAARKELTLAGENQAATEQQLQACREEEQALAEQTEEILMPLTRAYKEAIDQEEGDLPGLQQRLAESGQQLEAAQAAFAAAENDWHRQAAFLDELDGRIDQLHQDCAVIIAGLEQEQETGQAALEKNLAALQEKLAKREADLAKARDYVAHAAENRRNLEEYYQGLLNDENAERHAAEEELTKIEDKLRCLREKAGGKEQKFHATEQTLLNSSALLAEAEKRVEDAGEILAKTESELNAAEFTRKTHFTLADQASQSYQAVDKDTAAILRKASEDLMLEAQNAAGVAKDKRAAYEAAAANLRLSERNLASMRKAIKEAPLLSEKDKEAWKRAVRAYDKYEKDSIRLIADVENRLAAFLDERAAGKQEAEIALARCIRDSESADAKAEASACRVEEVAAEIARSREAAAAAEQSTQADIATAEAAAAEQIAKVEQEKEAAAGVAGQLQQDMELRGRERDAAAAQFAAAEAAYNERNQAYVEACEKLRHQYEMEKRQAERPWAQAKDAYTRAEKELVKAGARQRESEAALAKAEKEYTSKTEALEALRQARAQMAETRDALLQGIEEERLRVLGFKTIARIGADEHAAQAAALWAERKADLSASRKRMAALQDIQQTLQKHLAKICEDGVKNIAGARENTLFLQSRELH
ncbi:MAG: hypothetical protein GX572_04945 [Clostridia bacterium]|nr:hypothetical protein [Clostridia bacterium]